MSRNERRALIAAAAAIGLSMTPADAARMVEPTGYAEMRQLVEAHPEIDQAILPGLSAAPLLMGGKKAALKPQDVFNTSLWTGTGAARPITTGIDSGEGSLVWGKARANSTLHLLFDTVRGAQNYVTSNSADPQYNTPGTLDAFTSTGYAVGSSLNLNGSGRANVGWQFRCAPNFFKIVQFTGDGAATQGITNPLGANLGRCFIKRTDATDNWVTWHRSFPSVSGLLNSGFDGETSAISVSDSLITVGSTRSLNVSGATYIVYCFGHDTTSDGLIQCGSYIGNGSASGPIVNLGWRPQWLLVKSTNSSNLVGADWLIFDTARGISNTLAPNNVNAEISAARISLSAAGFQVIDSTYHTNFSGSGYAYMAIREAA